MEKSEKILENKMDVIICDHCHKKITSPGLEGLTLICPYCRKSVNGQYYHNYKEQQKKSTELKLNVT